MPRIRTIKPEFWADEKLSECDPVTRLVFLGLIGMADDFGRLLDNVKIIDAFIFPTTSDTCRDAVENLSRMRRIRRGETGSGQKVIQIVNWSKHQKVDKPNKLSAFPQLIDEKDVTEILDSVANESRMSRDILAPRPTTYDHGPTTNDQRSKRASPPPPATGQVKPPSKRFIAPTVDEVRAYCQSRKSIVDPEQFVDHYTANGWKQSGGNALKDWQAAVRTWEKNGVKSRGPAPKPKFGGEGKF